ncbi:unnamed protein product [Psylliodes chrysocephalus]|uniref:Uncharacterized protein n=1 Tax=Psylliodes chrysocephalus TaxID=3402493 RepID=A0A9P0D626_9CUCU|nr:unnamed protein product [Psylliodes chrysocephala]
MRKYLFVILITVILICTYNLQTAEITSYQLEHMTSVNPQKMVYLINTSNCRIPDDDPFNADIIDFIKEEKPYKCSKYDLLSYIDKKNGIVSLNINKSLVEAYSNFKIQCCYSNITRIDYEVRADNQIKLTDCIPFEESVELTFPYVHVKCFNKLMNVYTNVHATTLPLPKRTTSSKKKPKFSVLLLGIDSMSKSNIQRSMPKTFAYAEKHFNTLKGYNKIGENTFPNLMAILTGYNMLQLADICNNSVKLNNCQFIWDKFRESGYITAYSEDECWISTFNYDRPGFLDEPTDFYYHSYFLAAEKLKVTKRHSMTYCAGPETSGERLLNTARDFAVTFKDVPSFGLFWANSFSHDDVNMPAVMDEATFRLLSDPEFISALKDTILIFFSDHGFRFGNIRYTHSGWLEERLPFLYIKFPDKFKNLYYDKYLNFLVNTERLTVPYDLFNTFQSILEIGNGSYEINFSKGCPECLSLFSKVPEDRTCEDAHIEQHWCTCKGHTYINSNTPIIHLLSQFVVNETNNLVKRLPQGYLCSPYSLNKIRSAGISEPYINHQNKTVHFYLVMVETAPPAILEATVEASINSGKQSFNLLGNISRIDRYDPVTWCVKNGPVKKYCYCAKKTIFNFFKNVFSFW